MITSMRECAVCNKLWPWPISSRSFSHVFAIKLLKYDTSCCVRSTALTVLDIFPYLAQMITSIRCGTCNDLWPWPISSRMFSCDILRIACVAQIQPMRDDVSCQGSHRQASKNFNDISRQKSQISMIILNVANRKTRTTCYAWSPHTSYDHYWVFLRKSGKSSYLIWWIICL